MKISDSAIAGYANRAGFKGSALVTSIAIAIAESGGSIDVVNSIGCVGLWQIFARVHGYAIEPLKDPQANANAAFKIYMGAGQKFSPWTTYTGADTPGHVPTYGLYLVRAKAAASGVDNSVTGNSNTPDFQTVGATNSLASFGWFVDPHNWLRIAEFLLGMMLVGWALSEMIKQTSVGKAIGKSVSNVKKVAGVAVAL